jgi:hypothetical protein
MPKYIEIKVGTSINPNSGEQWWKADAVVSVGENEIPKEVFEQVKKEIKEWLPNPFENMAVVPVVNKEADVEINKQFEAIKKQIVAAKSKEDASDILAKSIWRFNPELNKILSTKPLKNKKNKGVLLP